MILVTGASGYIGRQLVARARAAGVDVVATVRDPSRYTPPADGVVVRSFDLARELTDDLLDDVQAVIHLAAIIPEATDTRPEKDPNVEGTMRLLDASRRAGVRRFVFLSSQSATDDAPTYYGQSKRSVERLLDREGEIAVRTGLICGGPPRGLYGRLLAMVRRLPALPVLRASAPVYPLHVDDLCEGLLALARGTAPAPRIVRVAGERLVPFGRFLRTLAAERLGRRIRILPVPVWPVLAAMKVAELVPFGPAVPRERIMGLVALQRMDPDPSMRSPETTPARPYDEVLADEGARRRLLLEGRTLTSYVLGTSPGTGVQRRYVRAALAGEDRAPLVLPGFVHAWPRLLRPLEPLGDTALRRRLVLATRIAEMSPAAAPRFHNYRKRSLVGTLLSIGWLVAVEAILLPVRLVAGRRTGRR